MGSEGLNRDYLTERYFMFDCIILGIDSSVVLVEAGTASFQVDGLEIELVPAYLSDFFGFLAELFRIGLDFVLYQVDGSNRDYCPFIFKLN